MIKICEMTFDNYEKIKDRLKEDFDNFWTSEILLSELKSKNSKYIVAKNENEIVGFAGIIITPDSVEITNIVTKKSERKKGIGNLLLDKIIKMGEKTRRNNITLEVNEENKIAINLYIKFGFKQVGIRKKYYNGKNNAIIMTKYFDI